MTGMFDLFKCNVCSNVVEIVNSGVGVLMCCKKDMERVYENEAQISDAHFARIEKIEEFECGKVYKITFNHEMTEEHYLAFIEVISKDKKYVKRKFLKSGETPELILKCDCDKGFYVRAYCNRDGVFVTK